MNGDNLQGYGLPPQEEKKKKKKGLLPWLFGRGKDGAGVFSRGIPGPGSTFGAAEFGGAAGGFGSLGARAAGGWLSRIFANKLAAVLVSLGLTAAAIGLGVVVSKMGAPDAESARSAYYPQTKGGGKDGGYVPVAARGRQSPSSLAMFAESNKGMIAKDEKAASDKKEEDKQADEAASSADGKAEQPIDAVNNMAQELASKLNPGQGMSGGSGSGSGMKGGFGDFGNKLGGAFNSSGVGFDGVMGSFQKPAFKNSSLQAMRRSRPVSASAASRKSAGGSRAFDQAKSVKGDLSSAASKTNNAAKATADGAWEGQTQQGGAGLNANSPPSTAGETPGETGSATSEGTTPSTEGESASSETPALETPEEEAPEVDDPDEQDPDDEMNDLLDQADEWAMIGLALILAASLVAQIKPWGYIAAAAIAAVVIGIGLYVMALGIQLMEYDSTQGWGSTIVGGLLAVGAAIALFSTNAKWLTYGLITCALAAVVQIIKSLL